MTAQDRKFATIDQTYKAERAALAEDLVMPDLWSVIDQWPAYVGKANLARTLEIVDLFRDSLAVPGDLAEFGVWKGATTLLLAKLLALYAPQSPKRIQAFDSFEGLTAFAGQDGAAAGQAGAYKGSADLLSRLLRLYDEAEAVALHPGLIEETLPAFLEANPQARFSFVLCDTDLYASTKAILDLLHPRMMPGAVFVLDEWGHPDYPGEGIAANEFLDAHPGAYTAQPPRLCRQPSLILRRNG